MLPLLFAGSVITGLILLFSESGEPKFKVSSSSDCNDVFLSFAENLAINKSKMRRLGQTRRVLQKKIKAYFANKPAMNAPLFYIQGSVKHGSVIRKQNDTCDVDVGIYFKGKPQITLASIQANIVRAIEGHTKSGTSKRQKCVRVFYASLFHLDFPIYYIDTKSGEIYLGVGDNWHPSDPKQFTNWVKTEIGSTQKLRLIMYFKAWADVVKNSKKQKMPSGLAFTIWVNKFYCEDTREDMAFIRTAYALLQYLQNTDENNWKCVMPVIPNDSVIIKLNKDQRVNFKNALQELVTSSVKIFESDSKDQCVEAWRYLLGKWFG